MTTNRKRQNKQETGALKTFLVAGSLMATLAGTRLLAAQEMPVAETAVVSATEAITVVIPTDNSTALPLPPTNRGTQIQLKQIPQVVQPQIRPVARTRSSR